MIYTSPSLEETGIIARLVVEELEDKEITLVRLVGDLGSGKTTFSKAVGDILGVTETINSPTFVIQKSYVTTHSFWKNFIHIDLYRIENPEELKALRFKEAISAPESLVFVEWPERGGDILPETLPTIRFEHADENTRIIETMNF